MAIKLVLMERNLEDLDKEITCAVCQEHFTDPKVLSCLHCYCKQCLFNLASKAGEGKPFSCPKCRQETILPTNGEEQLKTAFSVNRLKSMYEKHKRIISKQVTCEICENSEADGVGFCQQCDKFACQSCVQMHSVQVGLFEGHEVVPIEKLQDIISAKTFQPKNQPVKKCLIHADQLNLYCFDCKKLICQHCTIKDHKEHSVEFNSIVAQQKKDGLLESVGSIQQTKEFFCLALNDTGSNQEDFEAQKESVIRNVEAYFKELTQILETRKLELVQEAQENTRKRLESVVMLKKQLSSGCNKADHVMVYTRQCVENSSDEEVVSMHAEITRIVQEIAKDWQASEDSLMSAEKADMGVALDCSEALKQLCQTKIHIKHLSTNIVVEEIPKTIKVNEHRQVKVTASIEGGYPTNILLECQLKTVRTDTVVDASIDRKSREEFIITLTSCVRGRHKVFIKANGNPVLGSPYPVFVAISPTELNTENAVRMGKSDSLDIECLAVNSLGEIVVGNLQGNILILNNEGDVLREASQSQTKVRSLAGIAVDDADNVYYVDGRSSMIGKMDRKCRIVKVRKREEAGYIDIAVAGDKVVVLRFNAITVLDKGLCGSIKLIKFKGNVSIRHLTSDAEGTLFVTGSNQTIQVITKDSDIVSLDYDKTCLPKNFRPVHVHVCGPYLYVEIPDDGIIAVFTKGGDYVTMLLNCWGPLATDPDGFLYCQVLFDRDIYLAYV